MTRKAKPLKSQSQEGPPHTAPRRSKRTETAGELYMLLRSLIPQPDPLRFAPVPVQNIRTMSDPLAPLQIGHGHFKLVDASHVVETPVNVCVSCRIWPGHTAQWARGGLRRQRQVAPSACGCLVLRLCFGHCIAPLFYGKNAPKSDLGHLTTGISTLVLS